jgi:hypothetical protein
VGFDNTYTTYMWTRQQKEQLCLLPSPLDFASSSWSLQASSLLLSPPVCTMSYSQKVCDLLPGFFPWAICSHDSSMSFCGLLGCGFLFCFCFSAVYSLGERHLRSFGFGAILNKVVPNTHVQGFVWTRVFDATG